MLTRTKCILKNLAVPFIIVVIGFCISIWYVGILQNDYDNINLSSVSFQSQTYQQVGYQSGTGSLAIIIYSLLIIIGIVTVYYGCIKPCLIKKEVKKP